MREEAGQVLEGVGKRVAEVDNVAFVHEAILEGKTIVRLVTRLLPQFAAFPIGYLGAVPHPADVALLVLDHGEDGGLHAVLEQRVLLGEVDDVELDACALGHVAHAEEEPLVVALGVYVVLQDQVVLVVLALVGPEQVARLEVGVELDVAAQVQGVPLGLEALGDEGRDVPAHWAAGLAQRLALLFGQVGQVEQVSSKVAALAGVLLVNDRLAGVKLPQRRQLPRLRLHRPPLQAFLDVPPQLLMREDRLVDQAHVVPVEVVLLLAHSVGQFSNGARIILPGLVGEELNLVHEGIGLGD